SGRPKRTITKPKYLEDYVCHKAKVDVVRQKEPQTYSETLTSDDAEEWQEAMAAEWASFQEHQTADVVDTPTNQKVDKGRWIYKRKRDADGGKERFKARYVARGYSQVAGIDYKETFSPVVNFDTVRVALTIAAAKK